MKKIKIQDYIVRPSIARPLKAGLLMAFFSTILIAIGGTGQETGLGLSLSYDIIKAHRGSILMESKTGECLTVLSVGHSGGHAGTEFIIHLPLNDLT